MILYVFGCKRCKFWCKGIVSSGDNCRLVNLMLLVENKVVFKVEWGEKL